MSVYFIQNRDTGRVKIGFTNGDPRWRLSSMQSGCDSTLALLGAIPGTIADEQAWHAKFGVLRVRGEWFEGAEVLLQSIAAAVRTQTRTPTPHPEEGEPQDIPDFTDFILNAVESRLRRERAEALTLAQIEDEVGSYVDVVADLRRKACGEMAALGALLLVAKRSLPHGQWLPWLRVHFKASPKTALSYMRLAEGL